MIRERIGRAALRAYPPAARQARGLEMLGMLLDAGEQSHRAFARESASLLLGGLRERRALAERAGTRRLVADACCQSVLIFLMLRLIGGLSPQGSADQGQRLLVQEVVLAAILACALIGYERIAAVGGLAALIAVAVIVAAGPLGRHIQLVGLLGRHMPLVGLTTVWVLVPIACSLVMVRAPQRRPRDLRHLLWLLPVGVLAALHARAHVSVPEVLTVVSVGGLLRLLHDPRLAIACSLVWITFLASGASRPTFAGPRLLDATAVAAGLLLTIATGQLWIMRHRSTQ